MSKCSAIKTSRNEITEILYSDFSPEDKIIRSIEIRREAQHIAELHKVKTDKLERGLIIENYPG